MTEPTITVPEESSIVTRDGRPIAAGAAKITTDDGKEVKRAPVKVRVDPKNLPLKARRSTAIPSYRDIRTMPRHFQRPGKRVPRSRVHNPGAGKHLGYQCSVYPKQRVRSDGRIATTWRCSLRPKRARWGRGR